MNLPLKRPPQDALPPFRELLKSRDVEDPVNVWVHRPLAYGFVRTIFHTRITPNMVTFLAMLVGLAAGAFILLGISSPPALIAGGALLWISAILDGADGFLARAKGLQSQFGRALDGAADAVVAIATVFPTFIYLWLKHEDPIHLVVMFPTIYLALNHMVFYDYYKESYLRETRVEAGGEGDDSASLKKRVAKLDGHPWIIRFAMKWVLLPYTISGERLVRLTNPSAGRDAMRYRRTEETAALYRKHHWGPMQLWALISLAPHSYLMALAIMFDRIDLYLWFRLVGANVILVAALIWQRVATARFHEELIARGVTKGPILHSVGADQSA